MKSKKLLLSTFLLLGGLITFISLSSNSSGMMGLSSTGCGGGTCHSSSTATTMTLTGIPVAGFTSGSTYTLTLTVSNATKKGAGFDLSVSDGTLSAAPSNTMLMGGIEIHHTSIAPATSGNTSWTFNWTAPATGSTVAFNIAGNAVDSSASSNGDAWALTTLNFSKAIPSNLNNNIDDIGFELYPNPSIDYLIFRSEQEFTKLNFSVISLNGSVLNMTSEKSGQGMYRIDLNSLPAGIYILNIDANGQNFTKPFMKK